MVSPLGNVKVTVFPEILAVDVVAVQLVVVPVLSTTVNIPPNVLDEVLDGTITGLLKVTVTVDEELLAALLKWGA